MNSAQLYSELLERGERLLSALANEREANVFRPDDLSYPRWQDRLRIARRKVERAAESYAIALKTYRVEMLSALAPSALAQARRLGRGATPRERVLTVSAACRNGRTHARFSKLR
jgi:hypothetical protein